MRTTVDIPDPIYRELKVKAANAKTSVKELILSGVMTVLESERPITGSSALQLPKVKSRNPGSLKLGEEGVYEYIPFP